MSNEQRPVEPSLALSALPTQAGNRPWAVGQEEVPWEVEPVVAMSRRRFRATRGPYLASVPPNIADLPVDLDAEVSAEATEAAVEVARFDAELTQRLQAIGDSELSPLPAVLLRTESAASSQIEQITAGARALALASLGERTGPNAGLVASNAAAMQTAVALSDEMTAQAIIDVHAALLERTDPDHVGRFRREAVWIGGSGSTPHAAAFVAPRFERVPDLIDDLIAFSRRTDVAPFTQAAVAHAQFETIHPFPDGNGRTGRALVHALLRNAGITRRLTVPVSSGLLANIDDYYSALTAYRGGDVNPIVREFSVAAFRSCANGRDLVEALTATHTSWLGRVRARRDAVVWRALPVVIAQPAVTVQYIADRTNVSIPAAQRAVDQMVQAEVLTPVGDQRRSRVWTANEILQSLDDFAARAGRRQYPGL